MFNTTFISFKLYFKSHISLSLKETCWKKLNIDNVVKLERIHSMVKIKNLFMWFCTVRTIQISVLFLT